MKTICSPLRLAGLACVLLSFAVPGSISQERPAAEDKTGVFRASLSIDAAPLQRGGAILKSYADMLEKVQPSVVTILTGIEAPQRRRPVTREEQMTRMFFGLPPIVEPKAGADRWQQISIGSGVIVSSNGYILTNKHVVFPPDMRMDAQQYLDILQLRVNIPGREGHLIAKLIDFSQDMDVAVLKVAGTGFPHAVLADSDKVRVGDIAFALGAPFGIDKTVTMGIVSARRNDEVIEGMEKQELIQTDASINPGNSGGPLIDADGRVIGINTAIYSRTGGNLGIGFAIPINKAVSAADALSRPRGYLGVRLKDVDQQAAKQLYDFTGGAYVGVVEKNTPAAKSGLEEGDVILTVDGKKVESADDLRKRLAGQSPGTKVKIEFFRESKQQRGELVLTLGERTNYFLNEGQVPAGDTVPASASAEASVPGKSEDQVAGMTLVPVAAADRDRLSLPKDAPGLIITKVLPNSPAANCGLEKGDIILRINRSAPATHEEAVDALLNHSREGRATLQVRKGDSTRTAVMELK